MTLLEKVLESNADDAEDVAGKLKAVGTSEAKFVTDAKAAELLEAESSVEARLLATDDEEEVTDELTISKRSEAIDVTATELLE